MKAYFDQDGITLHHGHAPRVLAALPAGVARCCVTSPPYWGLRDYGLEPQIWGGADMCEHEWGDTLASSPRGSVGDRSTIDGDQDRDGNRLQTVPHGRFCQRCGAWRGCLGLEPTPELYVEHMVVIFREVRRVLAEDGTLFLNLGDSYATGAGKVGDHPGGGAQGRAFRDKYWGKHGEIGLPKMTQPNRLPIAGLKPKDLVGIPWMVAFALRADGWYLRSDIIWHKPNPMPESVTDRPTKAHEYLFLLAKSERYYYDAEAIAEKAVGVTEHDLTGGIYAPPGQNEQTGTRTLKPSRSGNSKQKIATQGERSRTNTHMGSSVPWEGITRNRRSVWTVTTKPYAGAHFATFPPDLVEPCILAGSAPGDTILDPFNGSGTTGEVAQRWGRRYIGIDLNPAYLELSQRRFVQRVLFNPVEVA